MPAIFASAKPRTHPPPRRGLGGGSGLQLPAKQAGVEVAISVVRMSGVRRMACEFSESKEIFPTLPTLSKFPKFPKFSNLFIIFVKKDGL